MNYKTILCALLIMTLIVVALTITESTRQQEVIHPVGQMTGGDENIDHYTPMMPRILEIPMDEMIYIPAYPEDECPAGERILIDTPIRVMDTDGTVYWHWIYENRDNAINRSDARYISDHTQQARYPLQSPTMEGVSQ